MFELMECGEGFRRLRCIAAERKSCGSVDLSFGHLAVLNNIKWEQLDSLGLTQLSRLLES
jgi:hypothetical protein